MPASAGPGGEGRFEVAGQASLAHLGRNARQASERARRDAAFGLLAASPLAGLQVALRERVLGIELDRLAVVPDGARPRAVLAVNVTEAGVRRRQLRFQGNDLFVGFDRLGPLFLLLVDVARAEQRFGGIRPEYDGTLIGGDSFGKVAVLLCRVAQPRAPQRSSDLRRRPSGPAGKLRRSVPLWPALRRAPDGPRSGRRQAPPTGRTPPITSDGIACLPPSLIARYCPGGAGDRGVR